MPTVGERRVSNPPLRYDWRRTYIWETPVRIVYVCQPSPSVALQAWRAGNSFWRWIVLDVTTKVVVREGSAGSLTRAKLAAEAHINVPAEPTIWETVTPNDDPVPF